MSFSGEVDFQLQEVSRVGALVDELSSQEVESPPGLLFVLSMATLVHGFYSGVERILTAIEKEVGGALPSGREWHQALLTSMAQSTPRRKAVISHGLYESLSLYRAFRHRFLNIFPHRIEWDLLRPLADDLPHVAERTVSERGRFIQEFTDRLD